MPRMRATGESTLMEGGTEPAKMPAPSDGSHQKNKKNKRSHGALLLFFFGSGHPLDPAACLEGSARMPVPLRLGKWRHWR